MTASEAIITLNLIRGGGYEHLDYRRVQIACNVAIEALEKQIPTKAKYTESQSRFSECSVCGHLVSGSMDYCVHCGQKLLWESDSE